MELGIVFYHESPHFYKVFTRLERVAAAVLAHNEAMPRTVLIVEDVDTCASTLEIVFSGIEGLQVITAINAEQALELLEQGGHQVRAIVTDLHMRRMDGFELIERIRADGRHGSVPIIVITGSSDPDTPERVRNLGANAFFAKPYSPVLVREKLEQLLKNEMSIP